MASRRHSRWMARFYGTRSLKTSRNPQLRPILCVHNTEALWRMRSGSPSEAISGSRMMSVSRHREVLPWDLRSSHPVRIVFLGPKVGLGREIQRAPLTPRHLTTDRRLSPRKSCRDTMIPRVPKAGHQLMEEVGRGRECPHALEHLPHLDLRQLRE